MTTATTAEFTHLHVASSYSLRYGTATPKALAARAADLGMPALALTDRDGLYGAFKHVTACVDAGIKPVLGVDLALLSPEGATPRTPRMSRRPGPMAAVSWGGDPPYPPLSRPPGPMAKGAIVSDPAAGTGTLGRVTLLATGRRGWASLCRLVSAAHAATQDDARAADDDVPAVTPELIAEHAAGLVVLLGPASDVGQAVAARRHDLARRALARWRYHHAGTAIEIVDHLDQKSTFRAARMAELARDTRTPAALTNAVRYLNPVDSLAAQVLDAARHLVPLGSPRLVPHNGRAYLASPADMAATAARVASAMTGPGTASAAVRLLAETEELARECQLDPALDLGVGRHHMPEIRGRDPKDAQDNQDAQGAQGTAYDQQKELRDRCEHAILHGHYRTASPASRPRGVSRLRAALNARDRLEHELDIIAKTGMASYFLTVADVADRIRNAGIRCAIRGSGAGSFINHLLGISAIDPLEHDLLMERFLSPIRNTLPDIDLDVESARRLDAYRIIFDRYGKERTACVSMMETYRARSAIRDVAAAMSLPPDEIGAIAKAFPHIRAKHITAALTELPELRQSRLNETQLATIFDLAQQLDGLPRHVAMHPCGVLLSNRTLLDRTAVQKSAEGFPLSQLDKDDAEIAGVIKLDVLGVRMQSAMAHTLTEIERTENKRIDLDAIRRDDADTYAMIQRSETLGCFQIESPGQRELVKKLAPRDIPDLIVDISLFRPGPVNSDMITPFLRTRHGLAEPRYPHQKLERALKETGGVVVFHEQVLRIIDEMTGCGLPEADLVRRHLSTEGGPERTAPWFRAQALARGFDPVTVERVWEVVAAFGGFGFCKAHAAAFAIPVYQSAWLKRHHPAAFFAGVLTHDPGMYPKRVIIADARLSGVQVLPVDINASAADWAVVPPGDDPPYPAVVPRGDDPPYPPMSGRLGLIAKTATVSGPSARTAVARADDPESTQSSRTSAASPPTPNSRPGPPPPEGVPLPARHSSPRGQAPARVSRFLARRAAAPPAPPQAIRCSLREIKGISDAEIARIVAGQPYASLRDFWDRARVSRPVAERLVLAGAFDSLYAPAPYVPAPASPVVPGDRDTSPAPGLAPRPSRRDLLARVGVLARQSPAKRPAASLALDLFASAEVEVDAEPVDAEIGDGMAGLVPAGELRDLDLAERVEAELEIFGFDVSQHVLAFYADLLAELGVVRSADLDTRENGELILVAGAKVATQTPAVRSGQRIIFASLDDEVGLVDLAFFESVQDRCAARLFGSWLLLVRGKVRRAGAGPKAVTINGCECWDLPALEEIRLARGMPAVLAAMAAGDVAPGAQLTADLTDLTELASPGGRTAPADSGANASAHQAGATDDAADTSARPLVFGNGFILSPYAETGAPGGSLKNPPRPLWHASPGSTQTPD